MQQVPLIPCPVRENLFQSRGYFYTKPFLITDEIFGGSDSVRLHPTSFNMGLRGENASIMLSTCSCKIWLICIPFVRVCWVCEGLMYRQGLWLCFAQVFRLHLHCKCQTSSGMSSLTWRCPFQPVTGVARAPRAWKSFVPWDYWLPRNLSHAFVMTSGSLPYGVSKGLGSFSVRIQENSVTFSRVKRYLALTSEIH